MQRALNFLSYRPRSVKEVRDNLKKHKTDPDVIEEVLERLKRGKLVDDANFAQIWVENRSEFRPRGRRALRMEMYKKGISDEIIEDTLEDLDEDQLAYRAAVKQARKYKGLDWQDFRKKMNGFLARRGFPYPVIKPVTEQVWSEQDPPDPDKFENNEVTENG